MSFEIKDSGDRQQFGSGMQRDTASDKVKWHLVADGPMLRRWADHMTGGAKKYQPRNWMRADGHEEYERFRESAFRHFMQWYFGDTDEDHASACFFNLNGAEYVKAKNSATIRPGPSRSDRIRVYISCPMSLGDRVQNLAQAMIAMRELIGLGYAPWNPALTFFCEPFIDASHADWVDIDLPWVRQADAVLRLPGESRGADREVEAARVASIPVFESVPELLAHFAPPTEELDRGLRTD